MIHAEVWAIGAEMTHLLTLLDVSTSTHPVFPQISAEAGALTNILLPAEDTDETDRTELEIVNDTAHIAIWRFAETINADGSFTRDRTNLLEASGEIDSGDGATCLYDAAITALGALSQQRAKNLPRQGLVIFTDGIDENVTRSGPCSRHTLPQVITEAQAEAIPVYVVLFVGQNGWNRDDMCHLAQETGGGLVLYQDDAELEVARPDNAAPEEMPPCELEPIELAEIGSQFNQRLGQQWLVEAELYAPAGEHTATLQLTLADGNEVPLDITFNAPRDFLPPPTISQNTPAPEQCGRAKPYEGFLSTTEPLDFTYNLTSARRAAYLKVRVEPQMGRLVQSDEVPPDEAVNLVTEPITVIFDTQIVVETETADPQSLQPISTTLLTRQVSLANLAPSGRMTDTIAIALDPQHLGGEPGVPLIYTLAVTLLDQAGTPMTDDPEAIKAKATCYFFYTRPAIPDPLEVSISDGRWARLGGTSNKGLLLTVAASDSYPLYQEKFAGFDVYVQQKGRFFWQPEWLEHYACYELPANEAPTDDKESTNKVARNVSENSSTAPGCLFSKPDHFSPTAPFLSEELKLFVPHNSQGRAYTAWLQAIDKTGQALSLPAKPYRGDGPYVVSAAWITGFTQQDLTTFWPLGLLIIIGLGMVIYWVWQQDRHSPAWAAQANMPAVGPDKGATTERLHVQNTADPYMQNHIYSLNPDASVTIGRDAVCDLAFVHDGAVSRQHARIEFVNGRYQITDLGSTGGTYVGQKRLEPNQPEPLNLTEQKRIPIRFGHSTLLHLEEVII